MENDNLEKCSCNIIHGDVVVEVKDKLPNFI